MIIMVEYKKLNKEWKLELERELDSLKKKIRRGKTNERYS